MPYCFSRSFVKFQGHTALKIVEFDPNWAFPDCNSSLNSPMATKCCTKLETAFRSHFVAILFLIYINDLCGVCEYTTPILFADDTNLFCCGNDLCVMEKKVNSELKQISTWLKVNKLSLNIKNTHYMVFTRKKR